jgi:hypothetical protein
MIHVRFGSLADVGLRVRDVRFGPESGHVQRRHRCLLSAKSGHSSGNISKPLEYDLPDYPFAKSSAAHELYRSRCHESRSLPRADFLASGLKPSALSL